MAEWSGAPAYKQVADDLRARIRDGRLPVDSQLPSLADLMQRYEVSITVIRMALRELRGEGLVTTHQGKGTFVRGVPAAGSETSGSPDFQALMHRLDEIQAHVLHIERRLAELEQTAQGRDRQVRKSRPRADS